MRANEMSRWKNAPPCEKRTGLIRRVLRQVGRRVERFLAIVGALLLIYHAAFDLSVVVSESMAPTLCGTSTSNGDVVLSEKLSYRFRTPRRFEVVAFHNDEGVSVMKRVVGLPGESLSIRNKWVSVDGMPLRRPSTFPVDAYFPFGNLSKGKSFTCDGGYYVLGDMSADSQDSRYEGTVSGERIRGRAWLIVWPPKRMGFVSPGSLF